MEYMAFCRCLDDISQKGFTINTFVSDRHTSIAKHFREKLPMVTHYFDLWHLVKSMYHSLFSVDLHCLLPENKGHIFPLSHQLMSYIECIK
jgi:hypothetical protein